MAEQMYVALIGDLVASREQPDRAAVQQRLLAAVEELQDGPWAAPLTVTAGDEVQALLPANLSWFCMRCIAYLSDQLVDIESASRSAVGNPMRFGIGWGTLTTGPTEPAALAATSPALLDGECLQNARQALERARSTRRWVALQGCGPALDVHAVALASVFDLMGVVRSGWTSTQVRYVRASRSLEPVYPWIKEMTIGRGGRKKISEAEDRSPSVITQALQAAAVEEVLQAENAVVRILQHFEAGRREDPAEGGTP